MTGIMAAIMGGNSDAGGRRVRLDTQQGTLRLKATLQLSFELH